MRAVHECQRLLEAVWPRHIPEPSDSPARFGRFSIVRELGRGGFGVVFLADDPALRRRIALKVPRAEVLAIESIRRRFLREAEAASRLDHPNIVPVYEMGEEGPVVYIASAYCQGPTLADWLRRRTTPVPWGEAARLMAVLAGAVAHAHGRGILHRDLKPSNILLPRGEDTASAHGGVGRGLDFVPRICDFGLAKLLDEVSQETSSGLAIGSPPYMAPEQAAGRTREQGPATDVYALGAILYELLTGRPPLRGETDLETLRLVSDQDPPSLRALRPGLPRDLETICLKCLEKRTDRRYAGAADLAEDLGRCLDGRPIRARPSSPGERLGKWVRRRPVHAALAGVIALSLASGLGVLLWSSAWSRRHIREMHEAVARAERNTQRAERSAHEAHLEVARADERERFAEHHGLASQLKLIHQTFESGNIALAAKMLETHRPAPGRPEPRGFAWNYLRRLFGGEVTALGEAERMEWAPVLKLAAGPDGRTIAAGMHDGRVVVWDLVDQRIRHTLRHQTSGPGRLVYFLAFSRDGRFLASSSDSCVVKIWDVAAGRELAVLPAQPEGAPAFPGAIFELRFTDTSDCLVVFRRDGRRSRCVSCSGACLWTVARWSSRPD